MAALSERELAVRNVLLKRMDVITGKLLPTVKDAKMREYLTGKLHGYQQAYDLLGESMECVKIEF